MESLWPSHGYKPVSFGFISRNVCNVECRPDVDAVVQQFYPGELGGLALAEVVFGDVNPSGGVALLFVMGRPLISLDG